MLVKTYEEIFGKKLTIRDLFDGFEENTKTGEVKAFGGRLNVRPSYQREFIYEASAQRAVVETVMKGYPLNVMYWAKCDDGSFELMDGQQRTLSICKFCNMEQTVIVIDNGKAKPVVFDEFTRQEAADFLDYPLTVYICDGDEAEKLAWFRVINISGIKLTEQEMRNAIYTSSWVTDAKVYFSNIKGLGWNSEGHISNNHTYGEYTCADGGAHSEKETAVVRQKLLEIVLGWAVDKYNRDNMLSGNNALDIDSYMRLHKKDANAKDLWRYYEDVMEWVKTTFPTYKEIMKNVNWGVLYNMYNGKEPADADEKVLKILASSEEISNPKEVYHAVLANDMKYLHARSFSKADKSWAYKKQQGICPYCGNHFDETQMQGDHIIPWSKGGTTTRDNLQMLCPECNIKKSNHDIVYKPWDSEDYNYQPEE